MKEIITSSVDFLTTIQSGLVIFVQKSTQSNCRRIEPGGVFGPLRSKEEIP